MFDGIVCVLIGGKADTEHRGAGGEPIPGHSGGHANPSTSPSGVNSNVTVETVATSGFTPLQANPQLSDLDTLETIQAELDALQDPVISAATSQQILISAATSQQAHIPQHVTVEPTSAVSLLSSHASVAAAQVASAVETLNSKQFILGSVRNEPIVYTSIAGQGDPSSIVKRPLTASAGLSTGQVVTKVIITKNPSTQQPQALPSGSASQPMQYVLTTVGSSSETGTLSLSQGTPTTPTKTITLTGSSLLSPTRLVSALPNTPTKLAIGTKLTLSPVRSPTKITMVPVSAKSPQRIAPAPGQQYITMVAKTVNSGSLPTTTISTAIATKPSTITMSPSKVLFKQQVPGVSPL